MGKQIMTYIIIQDDQPSDTCVIYTKSLTIRRT